MAFAYAGSVLKGDPPGPIDRAKASRSRTRTLLLRTTFLTGLGVVGFAALFGLRRNVPPGVVHVDMPAAVPGAADAGYRALTVTLRAGRVLLDGVDVGSTEGTVDGGQMQRLDGLFAALKRRRESDPRERTVVIDPTGETPAIAVKRVLQTALLAGYPDVSFMATGAGAP
jgi:hypothetical protein